MHYHLSAIDLGYNLPDGATLFNSLTFSFSRTRAGLIGRNGVGKSTLLDLLAGKKIPSTGSISRTGLVSYLPQTDKVAPGATVARALGFASEIEARERIAKGEGTAQDFELIENLWNLPERIEKVFQQLGISRISLDGHASTLSGGELMRVRLAGLLLEEPDFLLLDEPTNHLDFAGREFVYEFVRFWRKGLVVVSHDRALLSLVDQIAELDSTSLRFYGGNYEFYKERRSLEREAAEETLASAKQRLKKAQVVARKSAERQQRKEFAGHKHAVKTGISKMFAGNLKRKAENTASKTQDRHQRKVEDINLEVQLARVSVTLENQIAVDLEQTAIPSAKRMIEFEDVNFRYSDSDSYLWSRPLNIHVMGAERICLSGPNGCGKSTLINIICGSLEPSVGMVRIGTERIRLLDQRVDMLDDELNLYENLKRAAPLRPEHEIRTLLGRFLFQKDEVFKPAGVLSGGERMRAGLACLLSADQSPEILMLDEPTNNLDLSSIEAVASSLRRYRGTLIVVSHDRTFLEEIGIERAIEIVG